jgi:drug/metabolite transporter (DMT)-like permease
VKAAFLAPFLLAVAGLATYHVAQKAVPASAHPLALLAVAYAVAAAACIAMMPLYSPGQSLRAAFATVPWMVVLIALGMLGLEIGYLLAYRAGWPLSLTAVGASTLVALVLVPVGAVFFREAITPARIAGIVLCLAGLALLARRG